MGQTDGRTDGHESVDLLCAAYIARTVCCAVHELVHCACEMARRAPADHVTFGEFTLLVTELQELYRRQRFV